MAFRPPVSRVKDYSIMFLTDQCRLEPQSSNGLQEKVPKSSYSEVEQNVRFSRLSAPGREAFPNKEDLAQEQGMNSSTSASKLPDYCRVIKVQDANGAVRELVFPKGLDLDRPKRPRTTFTADQLTQLEKEFMKNQYLVGRDRTDLADKLGLTETQVKVWFQNRRTKYKRDRLRESEVHPSSATPEGLATNNLLKFLQTRPPVNCGFAPLPFASPTFHLNASNIPKF